MSQRGRISEKLRRQVHRRAAGRCEYCRIPVKFDAFGPAIDHVIARQHGGLNTSKNLALSCSHCNAQKGPNVASIDPVSRKTTLLFNPRTDIWADHFRWVGPTMTGLTAVGR